MVEGIRKGGKMKEIKSELWVALGSVIATVAGVLPPVGMIVPALYVVSRVLAKLGKTEKTGVKTTEFWVVIIQQLIMAVNEQFGLELPVEAIVSLSAYVLGRGFLKLLQKTK
jgi:hypothetical protein